MYSVLVCVRCFDLCTVFWFVYSVLVCVQCFGLCTVFWFVYSVLVCSAQKKNSTTKTNEFMIIRGKNKRASVV